MKVAIDVFVHTALGVPIGSVNGVLEYDDVPQIGDSLSFVFPPRKDAPRVASFSGVIKVTNRLISVVNGPEAAKALVTLEDIVTTTTDEGIAIAKYLEAGFGLGFKRYDP